MQNFLKNKVLNGPTYANVDNGCILTRSLKFLWGLGLTSHADSKNLKNRTIKTTGTWDGTLGAGCTWMLTKKGYAVGFNGSSIVTLGSGNGASPTSSSLFTIFFRMNLPDVTTTQNIYSSDGSGGAIQIYISSSAVGVNHSGTTAIGTSSAVLAIDKDIDIAITHNGTSMNFYINGVYDSTVSDSSALNAASVNRQYILGKNYSGDYLGSGGKIYHFGIYDRILSAEEIWQVHLNPAQLLLKQPLMSSFPTAAWKLLGNITESLAITDWLITATKCVDGSPVGTAESSGATYSVICNTGEPCNLTLSQKVHYAWSAGKVVALNQFCVPVNPDATPRLFKATNIGASPNKTHATTEPTWPSSGTVVDNDITWTYVADLVDPISLGPKIPS